MQNHSSSGANQHPDQHVDSKFELLQPTGPDSSVNLSASPPRDPRAASDTVSDRPSNGYDQLSLASQDAIDALTPKTGTNSYIHPDLREHEEDDTMMPLAPPAEPGPSPVSGPSAAHIAPAPPGSLPMDDPTGEGRKAKRELSQSKRAAQNRAAQRAFRQRKEGYIKKLEQQVREYADVEQTVKAIQNENGALRDYVAHLQSRLLEVHGDFPQPPHTLNLSHPVGPGSAAPAPMSVVEAPPDHGAGDEAASNTALEAEAVAVAGLAAQEQMAANVENYPSPTYRTESGGEDNRSAEEINRHLAASDGGAGQLQAA
ncbi:hypothetical protein CC79DRAFT_1320479 [Sarocladium strictum]